MSTADIILEKLRKFNNDILVDVPPYAYPAREHYSDLSDAELKSKPHGFLKCQKVALLFQDILNEMGVPAEYLFLYSEPKGFNKESILYFNKRYMEHVSNTKFHEAEEEVNKLLFPLPRDIRRTHAVLEVLIGYEKWVVDPMCGILYCAGKEDLLRGKAIYDSYLYANQCQFLRENIHRKQCTLYLSSVTYWLSVYHVSYDMQGGLPVFPGDESRKLEEMRKGGRT